jgi:hypothetical protein
MTAYTPAARRHRHPSTTWILSERDRNGRKVTRQCRVFG